MLGEWLTGTAALSSSSSLPPLLFPAQQEAQRAQFYVEQARQEKQEKVVRAEGEAEAARMISPQFLMSYGV